MLRQPPNQPTRPSLVTPRSFRTLRVLDASETVTSQGALVIIYGKGGAGKTTTAAKVALIPAFSPAIIFDAEAGAKAVAHMQGIVKVTPVRTWQEVCNMVDTICYAPNMDELVYKTFIFDNMTEIQDICLRHHQATDPRGPQRWPELQHHGKVKLDIIDMVRKLRDAAETKRIVIILNVWQKTGEDKELNITVNDINFIPSLTSSLPGMVDYIGWLTVGSFGVRELSFAASRDSAAKMRRPVGGITGKIPLELKFTAEQNPLGDMLSTLLLGEEWPTANYKKSTSAAAKSE